MTRIFERYKHLETVNTDDYYSKCNIILNKFKQTCNMNSNQYFYNVKSIIDEYQKCRKDEYETTIQ